LVSNDTPGDWEFVAVTGTQDGTNLNVEGVGDFTINAGECIAFPFLTAAYVLDVLHLTADAKIAVAHITHRLSGHDDFTAYTPLPTSLWGTEYFSPLLHEMWSTGYEDGVDSTSLVIVALEDMTVSVAGSVIMLDSGERGRVYLHSDSTAIRSNRPIQVVKDFLVYATDRWRDVTRMYSSTVCLHPSELQVVWAYMDRLRMRDIGTHGGPANWWCITSFTDGNRVTMDVGFDGSLELDTVLNSYETIYLDDSSSLYIAGWDSMPACLHSERPVQVLRSYRGWWTHYIESHYELSNWDIEFGGIGPVATVVEPLDSTISACPDQPIIVSISDSDGIDTSTIEILIQDSVYTIFDDELTFVDDSLLIFTPSPGFWVDNETVYVSLQRADDTLGFPLAPAPVEWMFTMDLSGPVASDFSPTGDVLDWQPPLSLRLTDNILGVDDESIVLTLRGVYKHPDPVGFNLSCGAFDWDGENLIFHPDRVDESALDISYSPVDEPELTSGIYFPELETIYVNIYAMDNEPDYCEPNPIQEPNGWQFFIPDDDTTGPVISGFSPSYWSNDSAFYIECNIADLSGVYDDMTGSGGQGVYLIWDNDGDVDDGTFFEVQMDEVSVGLFRTTEMIPPQSAGADFVYRVCAHDDDFDFANPLDRSVSCADSSLMVLEGPTANWVEPLPGSITACDDQRILLVVTDPDGVDEGSICLLVNGEEYSIEDEELEYNLDTLVFAPLDSVFGDEETVEVMLVKAHDMLGNPMRDTLRWSFRVDLTPPVASMVIPSDGAMVRDTKPAIYIDVDDNLSGVNPASIVLSVNGREYRVVHGLQWIPNESGTGGGLRFSSEDLGEGFEKGDTLWIGFLVEDSPDYCPPNQAEYSWFFWIEPDVPCYVHPNPFTPNNDGYNDIVVFDYPFMFSEEAEIAIYNVRNIEVWHSTFSPLSDVREFSNRSWDGRDEGGQPLPPGIYIYAVQVNGAVVCNGTIILAR